MKRNGRVDYRVNMTDERGKTKMKIGKLELKQDIPPKQQRSDTWREEIIR